VKEVLRALRKLLQEIPHALFDLRRIFHPAMQPEHVLAQPALELLNGIEPGSIGRQPHRLDAEIARQSCAIADWCRRAALPPSPSPKWTRPQDSANSQTHPGTALPPYPGGACLAQTTGSRRTVCSASGWSPGHWVRPYPPSRIHGSGWRHLANGQAALFCALPKMVIGVTG
jgi:hypothetical protein